MKKETSKPGTPRHVQHKPDPRKAALEVLVQARDRLLSQMTEEILAHQDELLDEPSGGGFHDTGFLSFGLQEIEDRYSARLNALNSLLENLEYRRPSVEHAVRVLRTTADRLEDELTDFLQQAEDWDLVGIEIVKLDGDQLLAVVSLTAESFPECES